jgi:uncharacterized caspase-like protein
VSDIAELQAHPRPRSRRYTRAMQAHPSPGFPPRRPHLSIAIACCLGLLVSGCAVLQSELPALEDVEASNATPIDGLWRLQGLGTLFRIETGRLFPMHPYAVGPMRVDTNQVVVQNLLQTGPNEFSGDDLFWKSKWVAGIEESRVLRVVLHTNLGDTVHKLDAVDLDDDAWLDAQLASTRIVPRPKPSAAPLALAQVGIDDGIEDGIEVDPAIFGRYHALVIGNDSYENIEDLRTARADASAIAELLQRDYGFETTVLLDATREEILLAFARMRKELSEEDNLLIFYAGHGWLDTAADEGYWLPVDAERENDVHWIANSTITAHFRALSAKHVLVVADSCYSGTLTRGLKKDAEGQPNADLVRLSKRKARIVLTSGGEEPVEDGTGQHSAFAKAVMDVLAENRGVIDATTLHAKIRRPVMIAADQTPEIADIRKAGHDGGDFLFVHVAQDSSPR